MPRVLLISIIGAVALAALALALGLGLGLGLRGGASGSLADGPVLIIGAGVAGAKVAHDLHEVGIPFLLLEAGSDVGGRLRSYRPPGVFPRVELGANWLHGLVAGDYFSNHALSTIGLQGTRVDPNMYTSFYTDNATRFPGPEVARAETRLFAALSDAYGETKGHREQVSIATALRIAGFLMDDPLTGAAMQNYVDYDSALSADRIPISYVEGDVQTRSHFASTKTGSAARAIARNAAQTKVSSALEELTEEPTDFFVTDPRGYRHFVDWHLRRAGIPAANRSTGALNLGAPVQRIDRDEARITLANGTVIQGSAVVFTPSLGVLQASLSPSRSMATGKRAAGAVEIVPDLSKDKRRAAGKLELGFYTKFFLFLSEPAFTADDELTLAPAACAGAARTWLNAQNLNRAGYFPGSNVVLLTAVGGFARELACMSGEARVGSALAFLRDAFGRRVERGAVVDAVMTPFAGEPAFRGSYSARPVGVGRSDGAAVRTREGKLFFAGEAYGTDNWGTVQSAWESGARAAKEVARFVK